MKDEASNGPAAGDPEPLLTFAAAAKACQDRGHPIGRDRLRQFAKDTAIGVRVAGTDKHPRLRVRMSELWPLLLERRYTEEAKPQPKPKRRRPAPFTGPLHPDVTCFHD